MDKNNNKANRKHYSLDGMLITGPRRPASGNADNFNKFDGFSPQRLRKLDDFNVQDGFKGQNNPKLDDDGSFHQRLAQQNSTMPSGGASRTINLHPSPRTGLGQKDRAQKNHGRSKRKFIKRFSIFTVVLVIAVTGAVFGKLWWEANKALQGGGGALALSKEIDPNSLNGEGDGRVNVLLLGKGGDTHQGGQLTDTIMIASLDPINNGVVLLSVPRDLWVKPDDLWPMKINAVYNSAREQYLYQNPKKIKESETAGIAATERVVEEYLGVKINYYGMLDFTVFEESVNTLGGITVNMPEPYRDPTMLIGGKTLSLNAGPNDLNGGTALGLARSRYGSDRGDFDRGRNQQLVLLGIKDKVLSMGTFVNPLKISQLLSTFGNRVNTNFSVDDIMRLYEISKNIPNENITNVDLAMEGEAVVTTGSIGGQSVVYPIAGVDDYSEVQAFVRLKLKDGFIIKENPSIIVLNASGKPGAATKRSDELKSFGYNVIQVADATRTDLEFTQLVDNNNGQKKYTKRYLELRFGTQAVKSVDGLDLSPYLADYIVVIGKNG
jgi:polyisoprenyl-teichoic acid--peptidoglycan teichoic acid transferase